MWKELEAKALLVGVGREFNWSYNKLQFSPSTTSGWAHKGRKGVGLCLCSHFPTQDQHGLPLHKAVEASEHIV